MNALHVLLIVTGIAFTLRGIAVAWSMRRVPPGPARHASRMIRLGRAFRWVVVGFGLWGSGLGLMLELEWLFWFAIVFGLEELYEAGLIIGAARKMEKVQEAART